MTTSTESRIRIIDGTYHITYAYDTNGNRIREGRDDNTVKEYTYNKLNQLISVKDFDGTVTTYAYDGAGNRVPVRPQTVRIPSLRPRQRHFLTVLTRSSNS